MLCRGSDEAHAFHHAFLPPIQLPHFRRGHAPAHQQVAHTQWRQKHPGVRRQLANRLLVEVVEVIVRQHYRSQRWQLVQCQRRRMEAQGARPLHGRGALGEHRVGDEEAPTQFQQYRGMPQAP
ncbi:hypothetical protein D3C81_1197650 [compost metagenome]